MHTQRVQLDEIKKNKKIHDDSTRPTLYIYTVRVSIYIYI